MKILLISCLTILVILTRAQASEVFTSEVEPFIQSSHIVQKEKFKNQLLKISEEFHVCPKLLFSMGLTQWEKISENEYESKLRSLANLSQHLN